MRRQAGFTLVEIAIVLVIIGLLLGGVLKGQELIESAKVKRIAQDFRSISIAVMTYQDKYRALPGDDRNAAARWKGACTVSAKDSTLGNGQIQGGWSDTPTTSNDSPEGSEAACVWSHLRLAGTLTGAGGGAPLNEDGGIFGVVTSGGTAAVEEMSGLIVCAQNIYARHVIPLDAMLDDGDPATGSMRATPSKEEKAPGKASSAATVTGDNNATYNVCMSF